MKSILIVPFATILAILTFVSCSDDDDLRPQEETISTPEELTEALNQIYTDSDAPGFAISIVKNDEIRYQKAFGKADIENDKDYTNQTTQRIASISKTFVAIAIVKSIEEGYFTLETNINDILPIEIKNPKRPDMPIKVKHLVTHTSGLIDNFQMYVQGYHILPGEDLSTPGALLLQSFPGVEQRTSVSLEDFLANYYLEGGNMYSPDNYAPTSPGVRWEYSNIATALAAYLVEVATKQTFKDYVRKNILQPLRMDNTSYDFADINPINAAKLYMSKDMPLPEYYIDTYPDGGILTSNEDLTKFLLDMTRGAKRESNTLFSENSYSLLFDALLPKGLMPEDQGENQGVFWVLEGDNISHTGGDPGIGTYLQFNKTGDTGFLLLTNTDTFIEENLAEYVKMVEKILEVITEFLNAN